MTTKMKYLVSILMTISLFGCSSPSRQILIKENKGKTGHRYYEHERTFAFEHDYLKQKCDSIEVPDFVISVELSNKAEEILANSHETIIVTAIFTGQPIDEIPNKFKDKFDFLGLLLCTYSIELTDKRKAIFNDIKFHKDLYNLLTYKDIELLINVSSGRKKCPDNMLSCEFLQAKMSKVVGKTFKLKGKLIDE